MFPMTQVPLADINANLLVALHVLLEECHVSRAAKRLSVTQSAMSQSLRQLRELFDDPLLVRGDHGLAPTARAESISGTLARGLHELSRCLNEPRFEPATSTRTFTITSVDHLMLMIMDPLLKTLSEEAPQVNLVLRRLDAAKTEGQLNRGETDLVVTAANITSKGVSAQEVLSLSWCALARSGHAIFDRAITPATFAAQPHVIFSWGDGPSQVDRALEQVGLTRRVALRVPSFLLAPFVVQTSDCVLTAPVPLLDAFPQPGRTRRFEVPVSLRSPSLFVAWHRRYEQDPANGWLRGVVARAGAAAATALRA